MFKDVKEDMNVMGKKNGMYFLKTQWNLNKGKIKPSIFEFKK